MKLTPDTLEVLKNFSTINPGIFIKPGKTIKTIGKNKNILAEYSSEEEFAHKFGIYELNNLLSILSLEKDTPEIEFDSNKNSMKIATLSGRRKIEYRFCDEEMITTPPEKGIQMPAPEISFDLSQDDFNSIDKAARVLGSTNISVNSDGEKVFVNTYDASNDSTSTSQLEIAQGNGDVYNMIFKEEAWKMIPGNYSVNISSKGVAHFKHKEKALQYWITIEPGSSYTGK